MTTREYRLLDLCCKQGGAGTGYDRAGFRVTGVDIEPQPRYPFEFIQADALGVLRDPEFMAQFDAVHASFPCLLWTPVTRATGTRRRHVDLITPGRELLIAAGLPYVIECVPQAPLKGPVIFCGPSFGLEIIRHRGFEASFPLTAPLCSHKHGGVADGTYIAFYPSRRTPPGRRHPPRNLERDYRVAMGVDWMTMKGMRQAIPPVYTEYAGRQLRACLDRSQALSCTQTDPPAATGEPGSEQRSPDGPDEQLAGSRLLR